MVKAILIIIRIGIVEFVPKETSDFSIADEIPNLNIYEKIQILLYENYFEYDYKENIPCYSPINKKTNETETLSIPIPNKKPKYFLI